MNITENVKRILAEIEAAAVLSGRKPEDITLVAATKTTAAPAVREAIAAGITVIGENRVQELVEKNSQGAYEGAKIHFIGHLQTNKVRQVVGICNLIESVDSVQLLEQISKRAVLTGQRQDILIEVNIGREESKSGVLAEELDELMAMAAGFEGIFVKGLMAIPPIVSKRAEIMNCFDDMYKLFVDIRAKKYDNTTMQVLSMGMSDDFHEAILAGANTVRIGSAIFGRRQY